MKPKPLVALKNFTVPIVMFSPDESGFRDRRVSARCDWETIENRKSGCQVRAHLGESDYNSALQ
jgi:hypothetical protein